MRRLLLAATALATLLAGGCGIPDDSEVTVVAPGPSLGTSVGDDGSPPVQFTRESAGDDRVQFVRNYLQAAAGDPESATERVKAFLAPDTAAAFQGGDDLKVVRLLSDPLYNPGNAEINIEVQPVGTLNANGYLEPAPGLAAPMNYKVSVDRLKDREGLFVTKAPPVMLLSDDALRTFYETRAIYFWNQDNSALVPDLRYMPSSVIPVQQPTTVLGWLAGGPAPWLEDTVLRWPSGTTAPDNVPAIADDTLQITLSAQAVSQTDPQAMDRLRRQLQWSLRPLDPRYLEIKVGLQEPARFTNQDYLDTNLAYRLADIPERFVIYNNAIRRMADAPNASEPVPVLKAAANKGISTAAISGSATHRFVAVVTGTGDDQALRVAVAPTGREGDLRQVRGLTGRLGRPIWAVTSGDDAAGAVGLVVRNGRLYSFAGDGSAAQLVEWPGAPGPISSVSVAPDGRRLALVSGGRLFRAVLSTSGEIAMSSPEQVRSSALTSVAAVAWSSETYLAVAGVRADGRYRIIDVTADGALSNVRLDDIGTAAVTDLVAYPASPVRAQTAGADSEAYVAGGRAWDVLTEPDPITVDSLEPPVPDAPAGTSPTAPFFLD